MDRYYGKRIKMVAKVMGWFSSIIGGLLTIISILIMFDENFNLDNDLRLGDLLFFFVGLGLLAVGVICLYRAYKKSASAIKTNELFELKKLLDAEIITEAEFIEKKKQLLDL